MRHPLITLASPVLAGLIAGCVGGDQTATGPEAGGPAERTAPPPAVDDGEAAASDPGAAGTGTDPAGDPDAMRGPDAGTHSSSAGASADGAHEIPADARMFTLTATDFDFEPDRLAVAAGETVVLTLVNQGAHPHAVEIHLGDDRERESAEIEPGAETTLVFEAPQAAGSYSIYCPVGNHRSRGMTAVLAVAESPAD